MKRIKKYLIPSIVTLVAAALLFYVNLPAINLRSSDFWGFIVTLFAIWFVVYLVCHFGAKNIIVFKTAHGKPNGEISFANDEVKRKIKIALCVLLAIAAVIAVVAFVSSSRVFRASAYAELLPVSESEFQKDISEISFSQIPVVDRDAAQKMIRDPEMMALHARISQDSMTLISDNGGFAALKNAKAPRFFAPASIAMLQIVRRS